MNIAVGFACLVAMVVTARVTGLPEQQLAVGEHLDDYDDEFLERKGHGGCGTVMSCGIAGGRCQPKDDVCDGELRTNKFYCKGGKKCGCCIPRGPPGCVFGFKTYEDGAVIEDVCMRLQCMKGNWKYLGTVRHECGKCQVWGDPHFITFDNHTVQDPIGTYEFGGVGSYVITQEGYERNSTFGLTSTFVHCTTNWTVSCVNSVTYYEPGIVVSLSFPAPDDDCHGDDDTLCKIQVLVNEEEQSLTETVHSHYATDGTVLIFEHDHIMADDLNCVNIVGSKGLSASLCVHTSDYAFLYVWTHASLKEQIYGLCGVYTGNEVESYTMRGGSLEEDKDVFGESWLIGNHETSLRTSNIVLIGNHETSLRTSNIVGKCTDPLVLAEITAKCAAQNVDVCIPPTWECPIKVGSCIFDLCRVSNPDNYLKGYSSHSLVQTKVEDCICHLVFPLCLVGPCCCGS